MSIPVVVRLLGFFLFVLSLVLLIPLAASFALGETQAAGAFAIPMGIGIGISLVLFALRIAAKRLGRSVHPSATASIPGAAPTPAGTQIPGSGASPKAALTIRGGFLFVTLAWITASLLGALPFFISGHVGSFTDSFFETMSGFTTTGASILTDIESLPRSLLLWRGLTHWLGGMGIVVLTVALFPLLGVGGFHLIQAEAPGPTVDRMTPRITETAKILWLIYIGFTAVETLLLLAGGMDLIDALTHTFATLATGGFSTRNASIAAFSSPYIHVVITVFMLIAGVNFTLYHRLFTGNLTAVRRNSEFRAYLGIFFVAVLVIVIDLAAHRTYASVGEAAQFGSFQAASIMTTTGFATADFDQWPALSKAVLFVLMFVGGCAGSTGGGIKVLRLVILAKLGGRHLKRLLEPRGVFTLRMNDRPLPPNSVGTVSGFFFIYLVILLLLTAATAAAGSDLLTSFSTSLAILGNIGPGFGAVGPTMNYAHFPDWLTWIHSFGMLLGRLELYTVLILFTPMFWKR